MGSRSVRLLGALLLASIALTWPAESGAYVRTKSKSGKHLYWNRTSITLIVHTADPPPPLTPEQVLRAARAAASVWSRESVGCSPIDLHVVESPTAEGPVKPDREFHVMIKKSNWCPPERELCSDNQLALTTSTNSSIDGRIVDMDVEVNATGRHRFADIVTDPTAHGEYHDLQGVLTHEFGHLMGFGHSCIGDPTIEPPTSDETGMTPHRCGTRSTVISVMVPMADEIMPIARSLSDDDLRGMCDVYGYGGRVPREVDGSTAGCALGGGAPAARAGLAPLALAGLTWLFLGGRRRRPRRRGSALLLAAAGGAWVALAAAPASAYVRTRTQDGQPAYWNHPVLPLTVHVGEPPQGLTGERILQATAAAAASWSRQSVSCSQIDIRVTGAPGAEALSRSDGQANVIFRTDDWCRKPRPAEGGCYDPGMVALTSVFVRKTDGRILDADIQVNAVSTRWSSDPTPTADAGEGAAGAQDLQGALTHELGHLLGFEHTCLLPGESPRLDDQGRPSPACTLREDPTRTVMVATVPPGQEIPRALGAEDTRALCEIYPAVGPVVAGDHAGCTLTPASAATAGPSGVPSALLLATLLGLASRQLRG